MKIFPNLCDALRLLLAILVAGLVLPSCAHAAGDYEIQVILPFSGGAAFVGEGERQGLKAFEELVNKTGGINGSNLRLVYHDDQSSPQVAVQITTDVVATHPAVIFGSTITAMCNAMAPVVAKGPVMYCFSPVLRPPEGSFVFSATVSTRDMARAIIRYFRLKGWTKLAIITANDATGHEADKTFKEILELPENQNVSFVETAHFNLGDVSVAAQIERLKGAHPQALLAWTTGISVATIFKAIIQAGFDVPVGTNDGNQTVEQLTLYAGFLPKHLYLPGGTFPEHRGVYALDPRVEKAQAAMYESYKAHGLPIDNHTGAPWDPAAIVVDALRKYGTGATAEQIRSYIAGLTDYAGAYGIYDFKSVPQRGLGPMTAVVTTWSPEEKRFVWVSKPGGDPLDK